MKYLVFVFICNVGGKRTLNLAPSRTILLYVCALTLVLNTLVIGGLRGTPRSTSFKHKNPL